MTSGIPRRERLSDQPCACGCGEYTSLGPFDQPMRFLWGHNARLQTIEAGLTLPDDPNPSGLCMCGCGGVTKIAARTRSDRNQVKGKHMQYLRRHVEHRSHEVSEKGCWIYTGNPLKNGPNADRPCNLSRGGRRTSPYRWYYELHVGPIPDGHHLHHTCENPMCVNPAHLEPLTPAEHNRRHKTAA